MKLSRQIRLQISIFNPKKSCFKKESAPVHGSVRGGEGTTRSYDPICPSCSTLFARPDLIIGVEPAGASWFEIQIILREDK